MNAEQARWQVEADETVANTDRGDAPRGRRRAIAAAVAIVLALAIAWFLMHRKPTATAPLAQLPAVTVVVPGEASVADTITATGTLSAKRLMPVGVAGEGGMVSRVLVDAGDWVRPGQTLATVDPAVQAAQTSQMGAQIANAQANAKLAQSNLDRAERLVARGFISKADIDSRTAARDASIAQVKLAQAQFREMAARLGRLDIRAPAGGLVLTRGVEAGQIVSSGSGALFNIAQDGQVELRARLAEADLARVRVGMPVTVRPIGSAQSFTGHVWLVSPVIDPTTRQGEARVQLAFAPGLRPGGFATGTFVADPRRAPVLPESAVLTDTHGQNYVYVVGPDNRVQRRVVKVGDVSDAGVAVLSGLSGQERVVYSAGAFLNPGDKVLPELRTAG